MPLVLSVSALEPASIHMPTVEVCAHGECSVAIFGDVSIQRRDSFVRYPTVRPLDRVVLSVLMWWLTGVAKPLLMGWIERRAARLRSAWLTFKARRRDAIEAMASRKGNEVAQYGARWSSCRRIKVGREK